MLTGTSIRNARHLALVALAITPFCAGPTPSQAQQVSGPAPASVVSRAAAAKTQLPGVYRLRLGDFQISSLSDGTVPQDLDKLLTGTTTDEVHGLLDRSFLKTPVEASINAFLIDTGSRLVLVDTGAGQFFGPGFGGKLVSSLAAAGYQPQQIDDILITHVHTDHSGGLVEGERLVFPNATIHVGRPDIDFFLNRANAAASGYDSKYFDEAAKTLGPYLRAGKVKAFTGRTQIMPGVTAIPTPGHTPGHSFYLIESRGQQLELIGDIVHVASVQLPEPRITIVYDVDAAAAAAQRAKQFATLSSDRRLVAAAHLPFPGIGHIRAETTGYSWVPVDYIGRDVP
jgi:glyoxylase-like metal-dependent hydrolase (beta-lactamase superfamily II)